MHRNKNSFGKITILILTIYGFYLFPTIPKLPITKIELTKPSVTDPNLYFDSILNAI